MQEYMIAHFIAPAEHDYNSWPAHLTLLPWFRAEDVSEVELELDILTKDMEPFDITLGPTDFLPPAEIELATMIHPSPELKFLHHSLVKVIEQTNCVQVNTQHIKEGYHPHFSKFNGNNTLVQGTTLRVDNFNLIKATRLDKPEANRKHGLKTVSTRFVLGHAAYA